MEIFQELLFTVALSLLFSFFFTKIFSMASSCDDDDDTKDNSVSVSVEESAFCSEKLVIWDSESERRVCFADKAVKFNKLEEEESRVETIDDEIDDSEQVSQNKGSKNSVFTEELEEKNSVDESYVRDEFREIGIESDDLAEKSPERANFREIGIESAVEEEKNEEARVLESEDNKGNESVGIESSENEEEEEEEEGLFDDWEGIERTELDKRFGAAVVFVGSKNNADRISSIDSDTKRQLIGLHKVAIEGPCCVPQPMALKVSARANWNAWQQLGDMNREVAMEQYITLLSSSIPGWMGDDTKGVFSFSIYCFFTFE
ncbi:hypothetical protein ACSBR2_025037 [Camellia fascicularis]